MLNPIKLVPTVIIIFCLLTGFILTYDKDYLPNPIEKTVYNIQGVVSDSIDDLKDFVDF